MFPDVIRCLTKETAQLAKQIILSFVTETRNAESMVEWLLNNGLQNTDPQVVQNSIEMLPKVISIESSVMHKEYELKRIVDQVLRYVRHSDASLASASKLALQEFAQVAPKLSVIVPKLSSYNQSLVKEVIPQIEFKEDDSITSNRRQLLFVPEDLPDLAAIANSFKASPAAVDRSLEFGFVPRVVIEQLRQGEDWKARVNGIQELESLVSKLDNLAVLLPYIGQFCKFLNDMLQDSNFKVILSTLTIIQKLTSFIGIGKQANLGQLIQPCINKLGDNKIAIRQAAFRVFKELILQVKSTVLYPQLLAALDNKNWHIREEVINVLIAGMLLNPIESGYDYSELIPEIAKLLDDSKTKIRHVATEALAVAVSVIGESTVNEMLRHLVDDEAFRCLQIRFRDNKLPVVREDGIELPKCVPSTAPVISSPYITKANFTDFPRATETISVFSPSPARKSMFRTQDTASSYSTQATQDSKSFPSPDNFTVEGSIFSTQTKVQKKLFQTDSLSSLKPPSGQVQPSIQSLSTNSSKSNHFITRKLPNRNRREILHKRTASESDEKNASILAMRSASYALGAEEKAVIKAKSSLDARGEVTYLTQDQLPPVKNPENELLKCMNFKSEEWDKQFEMLNMLRRLLKHSAAVFQNVALHGLIVEILKLADSLRSSLSKNALIVMTEMAESLGRLLDSEIESILPCVIKKATDTNVFISEQAEKCIVSLCTFCGENRILPALIGCGCSARSALTKCKAILGVQAVIEKVNGGFVRCKDFERTIQVLANFSSDASPDVRMMSKKCFKMLYDALPGDMDRILMRILNEAQFTKLKSHLDKDLSPMPGRQIAKSAEPRNLSERLSQKFGTGELKSTRKAISRLKMRETGDIKEFEQLSSISEDILSTEWKKRFEALNSLTQLMLDNKEALVQSSKMLSAIDLLSKSLQDSNLKVSLQAFNSLNSLVHEYNKSLVPHLNILFSSLSTGLGSSNANIRESAQQVCTALIEQIDANALLPALCNLVISMNPRTKSYILSAISNLVTKVGELKPALIQKNVLPVVFKLIDEPRIKEEISSLVVTIYASCGSMIVERAPASKIQTILDILNLAN